MKHIRVQLAVFIAAFFFFTSDALASTLTLTGPISGLTSTQFLINSGQPHGYAYVLYNHATVSGSLANGVNVSATGSFLPSGVFVATSVAAGAAVSSHVKVWTYYGELGVAASVPASWMAANATFVAGPPVNINAFKINGGKYSVAYTDPIDIIPASHQPMWNVPEAGWFHDHQGHRIYRSFGRWGIQNALNPASSLTRSAFRALTQSVAASGSYNYVEVDSIGWDLFGQFWGFNTPGVEVTTNTAYDAGVNGLLLSSTVTPIFNGLHNIDGHLSDVSGNVMFLPYSGGGLSENCLQDVLGPKHDQFWLFDENTMLHTTQTGKWAICEGQNPGGSDNRPARTYFLSSWWLTYDPNYSVAFPDFSSYGTVMIFPEFNLVPTNPVQTAITNTTNLLTRSGAYAREFRNCYGSSAPIGVCAAVVNPSATVRVSMPALTQRYHRVMVLDANNLYYGGKVSWSSAIPASLPPLSGLILSN